MICSWIYLHNIVHKFSIMFRYVSDWGVRGTCGPFGWPGASLGTGGPSHGSPWTRGQRYFDESGVRKVLRPGFDESARRAEKKLRDDLAGGGV